MTVGVKCANKHNYPHSSDPKLVQSLSKQRTRKLKRWSANWDTDMPNMVYVNLLDKVARNPDKSTFYCNCNKEHTFLIVYNRVI